MFLIFVYEGRCLPDIWFWIGFVDVLFISIYGRRELNYWGDYKVEPKLLIFQSWYYMKSTWISQNYMKIKNTTSRQCIYIVIRNGNSKVTWIAARNYEEIVGVLEMQKGLPVFFLVPVQKFP